MEGHVQRAWAHFRSLGSPKFHVAPMVDQSELPFRMLCRGLGAHAAYTPMLHARLYAQNKNYRREYFSTCPSDRPLFVQFCANDPAFLLEAARLVQGECDYVDINFGCPQRIAKRGFYGAYLMDNLPLVEQLVSTLAKGLSTPVSAKIRRFESVEETVAYALMIEAAGASLVAIHGRTRDQKDGSHSLPSWEHMRAVVHALRIPVLVNGGVLNIHDAHRLLEFTGAAGVLSAEPLLQDPALFWDARQQPSGAYTHREGIRLAEAYLDQVALYPVPRRQVVAHMHKLLTPWFAEWPDLRARMYGERSEGMEPLRQLVRHMAERADATGRVHAVPCLTKEELRAQRQAQAREEAIAEQERERLALERLQGGGDAGAPDGGGGCCDGDDAGSRGTGADDGGGDGTGEAAAAAAAVAAPLLEGDASSRAGSDVASCAVRQRGS